MKDLQYITHDLGARNDPKLLNLQMRMGGAGLAIFWCLVEMLWENDGYLPTDYEAIAFSLRWAKASDVKRVVNEFELFIVEEDRFWSRSALERIAQKKGKIQARSDAARVAGLASARARSTSVEHTQCQENTPVQRTFNERSTDVQPRNININKEIHKERDNTNNAPLTAADFFEIFFFGNVKDPAGEVDRFIAYYEGRGWKYQDGTPVTDFERAAKDWKPMKPGPRWDAEALRWYRAIWNAAKGRVKDAQDTFLEQLTNITRKGQKLALRFRSEGAARTAAAFIADNDLAGDWLLDYRIEN